MMKIQLFNVSSVVCFFIFNLYSSTFCAQPYHSGDGQDSYAYNTFFKNKANGVFMDIGANDGITQSNTYFFEKTLGWKGICVEPIPSIF